MSRQLTAIMFTDMVGYTALMQEDERQAKVNRDRQRLVLEAAVPKHDGRILQFFGDGTLCVFQSAIEAVECAISVQAQLTVAPSVPLRIGIHTGDIVHDEGGVFGDGVNVTSRVQSLSVPGGVLISDKVFDEVKNQPSIRTRALGLFQLKNVRNPIGVHAIVADHLNAPSEADLAAARAATGRSVAVLPFVNMSADPENEFFSDGITEELINALTRVEGLQVTARTSSFAFKGKNEDVRAIASTLGVTAILEGSVRRHGSKARITAQLIDAKDGHHLFSETYDRSLEDIFATQDELARAIVSQLRPHLPGDESRGRDRRRAHRGRGAQPVGRGMTDAARDEYLRGRYHFNRWTPQGALKSIAHYERAVAMGPTSPLPFSGLATSYTFLGVLGALAPAEAFPKAEHAALRAQQLDDSEGESHLALGAVKMFWHWDFEGAFRSFQKALALLPGSAEAHHFYGMYLRAVGDLARMIEETEHALVLDPLSLAVSHSLGEAYFTAGRDEEARVQLQRTLELDGGFRPAMETLGWVEALAGSFDVALRFFERMTASSPNRYSGASGRGYVLARLGRHRESREILDVVHGRRYEEPNVVTAVDAALILLGLRDHDAAIAQLTHAVDARVGESVFLGTHRVWDEIRPDPRFQDLIARVARGEPSVVAR
jgi:adenylate cyclase